MSDPLYYVEGTSGYNISFKWLRTRRVAHQVG